MKTYTKRELDWLWLNMTTERRQDHKTWYAFIEAYKNAYDY